MVLALAVVEGHSQVQPRVTQRLAGHTGKSARRVAKMALALAVAGDHSPLGPHTIFVLAAVVLPDQCMLKPARTVAKMPPSLVTARERCLA